MRDPKEVFTENSHLAYVAAIQNIKNGLEFLHGHLDDLALGEHDDEHLRTFYKVYHGFEELYPILTGQQPEQ